MVHFCLTRTFARGQAVLGCIKVRVNKKRRDDSNVIATQRKKEKRCVRAWVTFDSIYISTWTWCRKTNERVLSLRAFQGNLKFYGCAV